MRPDNRRPQDLRPVSFELNASPYAEGSVIVNFGKTRVLCTASVEEKVPFHRKESGGGWVTAEYGMLPRATHTRGSREGKGGQSGRTMEIQRLIGRSLRAACDLMALGPRQIIIDCDVLVADGGTRTAGITGGYIALSLAVRRLLAEKKISRDPMLHGVQAVSVGLVSGEPRLDLCYLEDSTAEVDLNLVTAGEKIVEIQGTAEGRPFSAEELSSLVALARQGCLELAEKQRQALAGVKG